MMPTTEEMLALCQRALDANRKELEYDNDILWFEEDKAG